MATTPTVATCASDCSGCSNNDLFANKNGPGAGYGGCVNAGACLPLCQQAGPLVQPTCLRVADARVHPQATRLGLCVPAQRNPLRSLPHSRAGHPSSARLPAPGQPDAPEARRVAPHERSERCGVNRAPSTSDNSLAATDVLHRHRAHDDHPGCVFDSQAPHGAPVSEGPRRGRARLTADRQAGMPLLTASDWDRLAPRARWSLPPHAPRLTLVRPSHRPGHVLRRHGAAQELFAHWHA